MYIPEIPENNLKPLLEELVYIAKKLDEDEEISEDDRLGVKFRFNIAATIEEIDVLEKELNVSLPAGYKEFLLFSNGAQLCGHMAEFIDTIGVTRITKLKKTPDFPEDYITIARIFGDGEILYFSRKTGEFIRYFEEEGTAFQDFYDFFRWLVSFIREVAEDYVEL